MKLSGVALSALIVVFIVSIFAVPSCNSDPTIDKAPDFTLKDLNGKKVRLSDFRGKNPVLLVFSTTW